MLSWKEESTLPWFTRILQHSNNEMMFPLGWFTRSKSLPNIQKTYKPLIRLWIKPIGYPHPRSEPQARHHPAPSSPVLHRCSCLSPFRWQHPGDFTSKAVPRQHPFRRHPLHQRRPSSAPPVSSFCCNRTPSIAAIGPAAISGNYTAQSGDHLGDFSATAQAPSHIPAIFRTPSIRSRFDFTGSPPSAPSAPGLVFQTPSIRSILVFFVTQRFHLFLPMSSCSFFTINLRNHQRFCTNCRYF